MKPVVKFTGTAEVHFAFFGNVVATITDVKDHPIIGSVPLVYTAEVVKSELDGRGEYVRIETINTIYEKEQDA